MNWSDIYSDLAKAKGAYQDALRNIDAKLRHAVRQDPSNLAEAKAVQESYHQGFESAPLGGAVLEQPALPSEPLGAQVAEPPALDPATDSETTWVVTANDVATVSADDLLGGKLR